MRIQLDWDILKDGILKIRVGGGKTCCSLCYFSKVNHSAIPINFESLQRGASTSANPNGTHHHLRKVHVDNHPNHSPNNVQPFDQTIDNMTSDARIFDFVPGRHTTRPVVEVQQLQKTSSSFWDEKSRKKRWLSLWKIYSKYRKNNLWLRKHNFKNKQLWSIVRFYY